MQQIVLKVPILPLHPKADAGNQNAISLESILIQKILILHGTLLIWLTSSLVLTQLQIWEHPLKMLWISTEKLYKGSFRRDLIDLEWGELKEDQDDTYSQYHTVRDMRLTFKKEGDTYYLQDPLLFRGL